MIKCKSLFSPTSVDEGSPPLVSSVDHFTCGSKDGRHLQSASVDHQPDFPAESVHPDLACRGQSARALLFR